MQTPQKRKWKNYTTAPVVTEWSPFPRLIGKGLSTDHACLWSSIAMSTWGHDDQVRTRCQILVHLTCTETRFQKCSQSGKNGSKHPMLSISMTHNVISCKNSKETLNKSKLVIKIISALRLRNHQKYHKTKLCTQSRFAKKKIYRYSIFLCYLMNPHEQTVQNMCERVIEGVKGQIRGGRSWSSFREKKLFLRCN